MTAGLTVEAVGANRSTTVGADGQFSLSDVPAGDVQLRFHGGGVDSMVTLSQVSATDVVTIEVTLANGGAALTSELRQSGRMQLEGRIEGLTPPDQLTVNRRTVRTLSSTTIRRGSQTLSFSDLAAGMRVHVMGQLEGDVLNASHIEVQNVNTQVPVPLNGVVSGLAGTSANFDFFVNGRKVKGDAATAFFGDGNRGSSFADLRNGVRVEVKGRQEDGYVYAERIHINGGDDDDDEMEVEGAVSGLTNGCPSLRFTVQGVTVVTSGDTRFSGGACAQLENGDEVEVTGRRQADGTVLATEVKIEDDDDDESASIEGELTSMTGSPPELLLVVGGTTVRTSSATEVRRRGDRLTLAALRVGQILHVVGVRRSDRSLDARMIQIKDDAAGGEFELEGRLGGKSGACPSIRFVLNGYSIATSSATRFTGAQCEALRNGDAVEVKGLRQADGTVSAAEVRKR
jgi:hypothetical protein